MRSPHGTLEIDMRRCDAYGYCAELLPSVVTRDEWGYPIVTRALDADELSGARRVVAMCPMLAVSLTTDDGPRERG